MSDYPDREAVRAASPLEQVVPELLGEPLKGIGRELATRCCWHDDNTPSLRINPAKQVWCCDVCACGGDVFEFVMKLKGVDFLDAKRFLEQRAGMNGAVGSSSLGRPEAVYTYRDLDGTHVQDVLRYPGKVFRQRIPDGRGGFLSKKPDRQVLYRLDELRGKEAALCLEGEKDCDRAWALGLQATTNPTGAKKWRDDFTQQLLAAGVKRVYVIPDNDEPGQEHAEMVARSCHAAGLWVRILHLPDVPPKGDLSDFLDRHTKEEFTELLLAARGAPDYVPSALATVVAASSPALSADASRPDETEPAFLDAIPPSMTRLLMTIDGRTYAATWLAFDERSADAPALVVVRDDGRLYSDCERPGFVPLNTLCFSVKLADRPDAARLWSGEGLRRFRSGTVRSPADVLDRLRTCFSHFVDFDRSLADQDTMCDVLACYVLGTYFLDAFCAAGSVWVNGEPGTGKSLALKTMAHLGYLGMFILDGGSYAALRDLSDYGALLCFDDAEHVNDKDFDRDKRALMLAGSYRGATVPLKEPPTKKGGKWQTRHVSTFCTRAYCAISRPDGALASRNILIPLVKSDRVVGDPEDSRAWPTDRRALVDDCWATAVRHLARVRECEGEIPSKTSLRGRALDPWRGILTMAYWLERDHGCAPLFERLERVARDYQRERDEDLEVADPTRLVLRAIGDLFDEESGSALTFTAKAVADAVQQLAVQEELTDGSEPFTNSRKVGRILRRLRLKRPARGRGRPWTIGRAEYQAIARVNHISRDDGEDTLPVVVSVVSDVTVVSREDLDRELFDSESE